MDLMNSSSKTVDALMKLDMPAGVDIEIKTQDIINLFLEDELITFYSLGGSVFFLLIFVIVYYFNEKILNNLDLIILIFLLIFSSSLIYSLYNFKEGPPFFCGGVPKFFTKYFNQGIDSSGETYSLFLFPRNVFDYRESPCYSVKDDRQALFDTSEIKDGVGKRAWCG